MSKIGFDLSTNQQLYVNKLQRSLDGIEADTSRLENVIAGLLKTLAA
jgi:hypothetical protein